METQNVGRAQAWGALHVRVLSLSGGRGGVGGRVAFEVNEQVLHIVRISPRGGCWATGQGHH